jgi:hypothetical protein
MRRVPISERTEGGRAGASRAIVAVLRRPFARLRITWPPRATGVDLRSLAAFRIGFGLCLVANWYIRISNGKLVAHYTDAGVLPRSLLAKTGTQWSFLDAFAGEGSARVAFGFILCVYLCFTLGLFTRVAQILTPICLVALYHRNPLIDDGSDWTMRLWALWAVFLPLGERFSIDAWRRKQAPAHGDVKSIAWWLFLTNFGVQYVLNAFQKNGPGWGNGRALRHVFWDPWVVTDVAVWGRAHFPDAVIHVFTKGALALELALAIAIALSPFTPYAKRLAAALVITIHAGFALFLHLGTFAFVFMSLALLFVPAEDWDRITRAGTRRYHQLRWARATAAAGALAFGVLCTLNLFANNPRVARRVRDAAVSVRAPFAGVDRALKVTQEWFMFRDPPPRIGTAVIYVENEDGTVGDFLRPGPFERFRPLRGSAHMGKYWVSYLFRMQALENGQYREALAQYLFAQGVVRFAVGEVFVDVPDGPSTSPRTEGSRFLFGAARRGERPLVGAEVPFDLPQKKKMADKNKKAPS